MAASRAVRQGGGDLSGDQATAPKEPKQHHGPTASQRAWLQRGLDEPGGKLPMFDAEGRQVDQRTVQSCIDAGWAEPWIANPIKPDWLICRLTDKGRSLAQTQERVSQEKARPIRSQPHVTVEKKPAKT
jgi:hypothetical protein